MDTGEENLFGALFAENGTPLLGDLNPICERSIGCAYTVSNTLGCGFLEKVYENAMADEIRKRG